MITTFKLLKVISINLILLSGFLYAQEGNIKINDNSTHWVDVINSARSSKSLSNAYLMAKKDREEFTRLLKVILQKKVLLNPEDRIRLTTAIKISGLLRISKLAKPLVDIIDFSEEFSTSKSISLLNPEIYSSVYALINIGKPSTNKIVERILTEQSEFTLYLCAFAIVNIEGKDYTKKVIDSIMNERGNNERFNLCLKYLSQVK